MSIRGSKHEDFSLGTYWGDLRADYDASKDTRFSRKRKGFVSSGGNADYHYRNEHIYFKIVEKSRDIERNDPLIGQGLRRNRDNVIRDGFRLDPQTGDDVLDSEIKYMWLEWCCDPYQVSITGEQDFHDLEESLYYQQTVDGDIFALTTEDGQLEVIENHRVRTPRTAKNVVLGVLMDDMRRRLEYWISKDDIDPHKSTASMAVSEFRQVPALNGESGLRQVLHIYDAKRASQTRGVTVTAPIQDTTGMIADSDFANLVAQQVAACFIMIEERDPTVQYGRDAACDSATGDRATTNTSNVGSEMFEVLQNVAPGLKLKPQAGSKLHGFSPDIPNPQYQQFRADQLGTISVNLDLPLAVLLLDPSMTNFSGWRGAIEQARKSWRRSQVWFSKRFHRPVYMWKLWQWSQMDGQLSAARNRLGDSLFFRHEWRFPRWEYIEPEKDARTRELRKSQTSLTRLFGEDGEDVKIVGQEQVDERLYLMDLGQQAANTLNAKYPDIPEPFVWRDFLPMLVHGQFTQSQDLTTQPEQSEPEPVGVGDETD